MTRNNGSNVVVAFNQLSKYVNGGADYNVVGDEAYIGITGAAATAQCTLESAANAGAGRVYNVYAVDVSNATVVNDYSGTALHTFTAASTIVSFLSNGSSWIKLTPVIPS